MENTDSTTEKKPDRLDYSEKAESDTGTPEGGTGDAVDDVGPVDDDKEKEADDDKEKEADDDKEKEADDDKEKEMDDDKEKEMDDDKEKEMDDDKENKEKEMDDDKEKEGDDDKEKESEPPLLAPIVSRMKKALKRSDKRFLLGGLSMIILAGMMLGSIWTWYATPAGDLGEDYRGTIYTDMEPGDEVRVYGSIDEIDYYGKIDTGIETDDIDYKPEGLLENESAGPVVFEGLTVYDNISKKKIFLHNGTYSDLLVYDSSIRESKMTNVVFRNVHFIGMKFKKVIFENVHFINCSFIDTVVEDSDLSDTVFSGTVFRRTGFTNNIFRAGEMENVTADLLEFRHQEFTGTAFSGGVYDDCLFKGAELHGCAFSGANFSNTGFEIILLNGSTFSDCLFPGSRFDKIFDADVTGWKHLDITYMRLENVAIILDDDHTRFFTRGTSVYGDIKLTAYNGSVENPDTGSGAAPIVYSFEVFESDDISHSLAFAGWFYLMILCGLILMTYAIGGPAIIMALTKFFLPFFFSFIGIAVLFFTLDWNTFQKLGGWMIAYFFPPLGKESVIPLAIAQGLNPWLVAFSIAFIDIMVGLFLVWNFHLARKIPLVGTFIRRLEAKGAEILKKRPWIDRLAFTGIVLFVMVPFQGSGAVGGTIVGKMLGMNPYKVWAAVIVGALVGCLVIAFATNYVIGFLAGVSLFILVVVVLCIVAVAGLIHLYGKYGDFIKEYIEERHW